jgi:replicative DNA helicase
MTTSNSEKVKPGEPPANLDMERSLLGAILIDNRAMERIPEKFGEGHFHDPAHGEIFAAIQETVSNNQLASAATLRNAFNGSAVAGMPAAQYLDSLVGYATTIFNVPEYARVLLELSQRRSLIAASQDMIGACQRGAVDQPVASIIEALEATILKVSEGAPVGDDEVSFERAVDLAIERANEAFKRGTKIVGLSSGITDLDNIVGGLAPSDLIIIGGRPGMGKTSLATSIAYNVASKFLRTDGGTGAPVHFFSQEMSAEQLATRIVSEQSDLSSERVRRGDFEQRDFAKLMETGSRIGATPIIIDQTGGLTLSQLSARARRIKRKKNTGLIIVDYLQLMYGTSKENRNQDLTRITNGLKALAKELSVPVLALSQLSRGVENREDKRPHLADLRESGSIEQDADIVTFVYREEYYLERTKPAVADLEWDAKMALVKNKAEVLVAKHRHGRTGSVTLQFTPEFTRFSNLAGPQNVSDVHAR